MSDLPPVTDQEVVFYESLLAQVDNVMDPSRYSEIMAARDQWVDWIASNHFVERLLADRKRDKERILDLEDTVKSLINQYAYEQTRDDVPVLWAGYQRTLEYAYDVMGYPNPVPVEVIRGPVDDQDSK